MRILVIDDEEGMRHMLSVILRKEGYEVSTAEDGKSGVKGIKKEEFDFVLCDIRMPGLDGLGVLKELSALEVPKPTVIMMSAYGTIDTALECMKLGAYDFISKPFKADEIVLTIKKAEEREKLKRENKRLREELTRGVESFFAEDEKMVEVLALIDKVADYDTTVLVTGETGTGKELIARAVHERGKRRGAPFVAVNCGAIPEKLLESELFGHVKGAFTDAVSNKMGLFQMAEGGTVFLDEIGELERELQVKLLRVLQEGEIRRVGDTKDIEIDVRVVAATIKDLKKAIRDGTFREDLFYRLNVLPINVPPLRDRRGDISGLIKIFIEKYSLKYSKTITGVDDDALAALRSYGWPGNVRELENVIERAIILESSASVSLASLPQFETTVSLDYDLGTLSIKKAHEVLEKDLIKKALSETGGNRTQAAKLLEISHRALLYKIKSFGL